MDWIDSFHELGANDDFIGAMPLEMGYNRTAVHSESAIELEGSSAIWVTLYQALDRC